DRDGENGCDAHQGGPRVRRPASDPGGVGETGVEQPGDRPPLLLLIARDRPGGSYRRAIETSPRDELLDQPALPLAGLTLDDNHLPPPALGPLPRGCQRRELSAPSAQGRARPRGWRRREHAAAHARIPDAVGEPRGIGPRRGPDLRPERVPQLVGDA